MMAVGESMQLNQYQLLSLLHHLTRGAMGHDTSSFFISREDLRGALHEANIVHPSTQTLIDLLFTMWDHNGDNSIPGRDFVVGMTPLASPSFEQGTCQWDAHEENATPAGEHYSSL